MANAVAAWRPIAASISARGMAAARFLAAPTITESPRTVTAMSGETPYTVESTSPDLPGARPVSDTNGPCSVVELGGESTGPTAASCALAGETIRTDSSVMYSGGAGESAAIAKVASTTAEIAVAPTGAPQRTPPNQRRTPRPAR